MQGRCDATQQFFATNPAADGDTLCYYMVTSMRSWEVLTFAKRDGPGHLGCLSIGFTQLV